MADGLRSITHKTEQNRVIIEFTIWYEVCYSSTEIEIQSNYSVLCALFYTILYNQENAIFSGSGGGIQNNLTLVVLKNCTKKST